MYDSWPRKETSEPIDLNMNVLLPFNILAEMLTWFVEAHRLVWDNLLASISQHKKSRYRPSRNDAFWCHSEELGDEESYV